MAIGTLTVGVAANATKGVASLKGFRKEVKGVKADCSIASKAVSTFTGGITRVAGSLAAAGASYLSVRTFQTIAADLDLVAKTSAKLNVAPVALMGLRHAAEQTGVATQTLDNALSKMTIRASEAAKGGGDAAAAFKELGIDAKAFALLSADQQFIKVAGAMNQQTNQADKLRIATKLFEEEGAALVATLGLGESGLNKMTSEAAKLTGSFSAAELAKVEKFNDEMDKLSKLLGGIGSEIVIDIAPAATQAISDLREAIQYVREKGGVGGVGGDGFATRVAKNATASSSLGSVGMIASGAVSFYQGGHANRALSSLDYFSDPGDAGQLTAAERATQKARGANPKADNIGALWKSGAAELGVAAKSLMEGVAGSLNTVGSQINTGVAQANAAKRRGLGYAAMGLNPLTGLAPLGMSEARRALMEGPAVGKPMGPVSDRINRLVDAGGSEGYMALRANQRQAKLNPADKAAPKIEKNTDRSAKAAEQLLEFFRKIPAPRSAGPA